MGWHKGDWHYAFHDLLPFVYACYLVNVCIGIGVRRFWKRGKQTANNVTSQRSPSRALKGGTIALGSFAGSVIFFLVTNFAVWVLFPTYPHTAIGLLECYEAGLPYFRTTVAADFVFAAAFFGGFALLRGQIPVLAESQLLYAE